MTSVIDPNCPLCGTPARLPRASATTQFVCKKCHTPFYIKAGRAVVGEARSVSLRSDEGVPSVEELEAMKERLQGKLQENLQKVSIGKVATWAGAAVAAVVVLYVLLRPAERLDKVAERAGQAFSHDDVSYLKSIAAPGTAEDVVRWFDEVHPRLVQMRERWSKKDEVVDVHVAQEDRDRRTGTVGLSIHPGAGTARDVSLADPSAATAGADVPVDLSTSWTRSRWGGWRLDGRETLARLHNP
jgi:hypothetical protein